MTQVSIIIRTKNEAQFLPLVLAKLAQQTMTDFEIIIVDDHSTDQTLSIAKNYQKQLNLKILSLPERFSYPYACNFGAKQASAPIIGFLSGHSVPVFDDYLEKGLGHFTSPKVAGVYGPVLPLANATLAERLYYTGLRGEKLALKVLGKQLPKAIKQPKLGLLGSTNSLIRKDSWQLHHFNEKLVNGGEDTEWAYYWQRQGKIIINEPGLSVRHSHGISLWALIGQYRNWQKIYHQAISEVESKVD